MKSNDCSFELIGLRNKISKVDLFHIKTIFGVGISIDRRKNEGYDNYRVNDEILFENVPTTTYVKKRIDGDEMAAIIL